MSKKNQMLAVHCKDCGKVQAVSVVEGGTGTNLRSALKFLAPVEKRNGADAVFVAPFSQEVKPENWCKCGEKKTSPLVAAKRGTLAYLIVEYAEAKSHLDMMKEYGVSKDILNAEKIFATATANMERALAKVDKLEQKVRANKPKESKND